MERQDIYVYEIEGKTYINLTNRCNNNCDFCVRKNGNIEGIALWISKEPTAEEVIQELQKQGMCEEVVFCGFGEPTIKLEELKEIAEYVKQQGKLVRINTNGLANLFFKRNVLPELKNLVDVISISLNATNAEDYDKICHSIYGLDAYPALLDFAEKSVKEGIKTVFSVVDVISSEEIHKAESIAKNIGATLRVRQKIN